MNVCLTSPSRFHLVDLAVELHRSGQDVRVYAGVGRKRIGLPASVGLETFPIVTAVTAAQRWRIAKWDRWATLTSHRVLDRWVSRRLARCDVFHFLSGFGLTSQRVARDRWGALAVCDRSSTHIVAQEQLLREEHERWGLPFRPFHKPGIERELAEYDESELILTPSSFARRTFLERGFPPEKVTSVSFGADLEDFKRSPRDDAAFRVLFVGALSIRKGIGDVFDAVARARRDGDFELSLAGPLARESKVFMSRHEGTFTYLGVVPRSDLAGVYNRASVLVLPSIEEGQALVIGQALACGLPVIASTNTGAEDLITSGREGFIVPIRDPEAIADAIRRLRDDSDLRRQMSEAAYQRARSFRGWSNYAANVLTAYESAR